MSKYSLRSASWMEYREKLVIPDNNLLDQNAKRQLEDIKWNSKNPATSIELYRCYKTHKNVRVYVDEKNWKTELPELCKLLGLRYTATEDEVLAALESSDAFQRNSTLAFAESMYEAGKKVQYNVSTMENGKLKLQITIPMMYQDKFAFKDSEERIELELFTQQELARVFKIPEYLLSSEISVVDVKPGSVVIYVVLSVASLLLVLIGQGLIQTPEWKMYKFKILMALGGLVLGGVVGLFGGPLGLFVGGIIGWTLGLGTAWFLKLPQKEEQAKATAAITCRDNVASVTVTFNNRPSDNLAPSHIEERLTLEPQ